MVYFQEALSKWTRNRGSSPGGTRAHDGQGRQHVARAEAGGDMRPDHIHTMCARKGHIQLLQWQCVVLVCWHGGAGIL